ncbi:MAG: transaminase [Steroidobacteraceae bacterium]
MFDARRVAQLAAAEAARFAADHPGSAALAPALAAHWLNGVPMHWMRDWGTPFPLVLRAAQGAVLTDVDGHRYADFCLGDTGAMFGHSPPAVAQAIATQAARGLTAMLPDERAAAVGVRLAQLFGLPFWQMTQTASDANRAALRWARALTGRPKVLVFTGCYHGTVDDVMLRPGGIGAAFDARTSAVEVEFDDSSGLESRLRAGDIAALLYEPVMTNMGLVLPQPGLHEAVRTLTRRHGTLLVVDETHTLSSGVGGETRTRGLEPDILVCGKAIAGGLPCAVYGFTAAVEAGMQRVLAARGEAQGHSGMGTTLAANPLALAALAAALETLHTRETYRGMLAGAERLDEALRTLFARRRLGWHVARVGARLEIGYGEPAANATQSAARMQPALERAMHLSLLNRGFLLTPFHNMMLYSPVTAADDAARLVAAIDTFLGELA